MPRPEKRTGLFVDWLRQATPIARAPIWWPILGIWIDWIKDPCLHREEIKWKLTFGKRPVGGK
ncbi:hypothetical protein K0M31_013703 [Melipona bicolor]|uniref:Uncharacterized protein n=1 Tax=Melipona bicolor TaxID=60889 RepID=A0AA40KGE3_9HYME|nr:hypothetical protein K0M31_013703 [Melipona bicolor]